MQRFKCLWAGVLALLIFSFMSLPVKAQTAKQRESTENLMARAEKRGKLPVAREAYLKLSESVYGKSRRIIPLRAIIGDVAGDSKVIQFGNMPEGYGGIFEWDRDAMPKVELAIYLNSADYLGVQINGMEEGDYINVPYVSGLASFDEGDGNSWVSSVITLTALAAEVGATLYGVPEVAPLIAKGEAFAQKQFGTEKKHKKMRRDAFGLDPGTGKWERAEGGVLVSLPGSGGPYYSGGGKAKHRWIKKNEPRYKKNYPDHITRGFFLLRGSANAYKMGPGGGSIFVIPWDHKFEDNVGFYKVTVRLMKSTGPGEPVVIK